MYSKLLWVTNYLINPRTKIFRCKCLRLCRVYSLQALQSQPCRRHRQGGSRWSNAAAGEARVQRVTGMIKGHRSCHRTCWCFWRSDNKSGRGSRIREIWGHRNTLPQMQKIDANLPLERKIFTWTAHIRNCWGPDLAEPL